MSDSAVKDVLQRLHTSGLTLATFLRSFLSLPSYAEHEDLRELKINLAEILDLFHGNATLCTETSLWAKRFCQKECATEVLELTTPRAGLHYTA